jgi:serine/threonine protein kinase
MEEFIDSGGMGKVYRVWDLKRNVSVAMKVLNSDLVDDPAAL